MNTRLTSVVAPAGSLVTAATVGRATVARRSSIATTSTCTATTPAAPAAPVAH